MSRMSVEDQLREEGKNEIFETVAKNCILSDLDWGIISNATGFSMEKLNSIKDALSEEEKKELQEKIDIRITVDMNLEQELNTLIEEMETSLLKQRSKKTRKKLISILDRYLSNHIVLDLWTKIHIQSALTCLLWHWYKPASYDIKLIFTPKNEIPQQFIYNEVKKEPLQRLTISDFKNALNALSFEWWR